MSIANITLYLKKRKKIIDARELRKLLSANIKDRRKKLGISQEKLAELTELSVQTINFIEGCRTWVSDNTLIKLADVLGVEVFQLVGPIIAGDREADEQKSGTLNMQLLGTLRQYIKSDIDGRFEDFMRR